MNKVILMGRLTRDPEIRYTDQKMCIARFALAVDRRKKDQEQTADFPSCIAFGKSAEAAEKWLAKGKKIIVEGRIQTGSYTNKDGQKVYTTDVIVESWEFAESKSAEQTAAPSAEPAQDSFAPIDPVDDAGLPFK